MRDSGALERISRGVYRLADLPPLSDPDLVSVATRVPAGVETRTLHGVPIRIYSPAKTIADCFKHRNKIGIGVAVEALRTLRLRSNQTGSSSWRRAAGPSESRKTLNIPSELDVSWLVGVGMAEWGPGATPSSSGMERWSLNPVRFTR